MSKADERTCTCLRTWLLYSSIRRREDAKQNLIKCFNLSRKRNIILEEVLLVCSWSKTSLFSPDSMLWPFAFADVVEDISQLVTWKLRIVWSKEVSSFEHLELTKFDGPPIISSTIWPLVVVLLLPRVVWPQSYCVACLSHLIFIESPPLCLKYNSSIVLCLWDLI